MLSHDISALKSRQLHRERVVALNDVSRRVATSLLEQDDLHRAIGIILEGVGKILAVGRSFLCRFREDRRWIFRTHEWDGAEVQRPQLKPESSQPYEWLTRKLVRGEVVRVGDVAGTGHGTAEGSALLRPDAKAILVLPVVIHGRLESFFGFVDPARPRTWEEEEVSTLEIIVDSFARAVERRIAERERTMIARDLERSVARERQANRYKSEFLASMSHELRTPMNAIVGYAELLGRPNVDRRKQENWLAAIRRSTEHLLSLVNDVLDLSKIEAGQMTVQPGPCRLADLVGEVEGLLRGNAEEKLLDFEVVYERPVPEIIETDRVRFKQILINLVGNAIKFTERGSITIRVDLRERPGSDGDKELLITVEDTGVGIAADQLERLFRPFYQAHSELDHGVRGTGLGLDISRHLARLLGGEISVESELGKGSRFTLHLALGSEESQCLSLPDAAPIEPHGKIALEERFLQGRRVLIVDDNADNREVLRFLLTETGCVCESAENGALGVKAATEAHVRGAPYDVILMDMNMPVMDGYAATAELRKRGNPSPVVALTALATKDDEERCREAGCIDYITKPVVPSTFFKTIVRHVRPIEAVPELDPVEETRGFSLVGNPRFAPLIRRYIESFPEQVAILREAHAEGRVDDVRTRVHRLRGTATNYGFPEVSRAAGECEDAIRGGRPSAQVDILLERLIDLLIRIHER
jgi:signal transduction histidine kinase/HPt (histidine-containing phosphotransfer) domain-containing protein